MPLLGKQRFHVEWGNKVRSAVLRLLAEPAKAKSRITVDRLRDNRPSMAILNLGETPSEPKDSMHRPLKFDERKYGWKEITGKIRISNIRKPSPKRLSEGRPMQKVSGLGRPERVRGRLLKAKIAYQQLNL